MSVSKPDHARIRATVQYDGAAFHGSQLQPEVRTVQGDVEAALSRLLDRPVRIDLAGRTDTGVHATAQEIAFDAPRRRSPDDLLRGARALLPEEIAVTRLRLAPEGFHPRFDASARRYEYLVAAGELAGSPFLRERAWGIPDPLDGDRLAAAASAVVGQRSFGGFAKSGQPERGTRCHVQRAEWMPGPGPYLRFEVIADRFLHHMVRYLVGTMVEVALDRRPADDIAALLAGETPTRAVFPAPPEGLYLTGVRYGDDWNAPAGIGWVTAS